MIKIYIPYSEAFLMNEYKFTEEFIITNVRNNCLEYLIRKLLRKTSDMEICVLTNDYIPENKIRSDRLKSVKRPKRIDLEKDTLPIINFIKEINNGLGFILLNPLFPLIEVETIKVIYDLSLQKKTNVFSCVSGLGYFQLKNIDENIFYVKNNNPNLSIIDLKACYAIHKVSEDHEPRIIPNSIAYKIGNYEGLTIREIKDWPYLKHLITLSNTQSIR